MQTPSPSQNCSYFHERCAQCWIEWKINFPLSNFWITADCIYNIRLTHLDFQVCHRAEKKVVQKWSNSQKRCAMSWNEWLIHFSIFIFSVMVDFVLKLIEKLTNFEYKNNRNAANIPKPFVPNHHSTTFTHGAACYWLGCSIPPS